MVPTIRGLGEEPYNSHRSELADGFASEDPEFDSTNFHRRNTQRMAAHRLSGLPMAADADARESGRLWWMPPRF